MVDKAATSAVAALPHGVIQRQDGVFVDTALPPATLAAGVGQLFLGGWYLSGLQYATLRKLLFNVGPALPPTPDTLVRVADSLQGLDARRRALYRGVKRGHGVAEYVFEPLFFAEEELPDGTILPERAAQLDIDEFVADMWCKGIRFGLDLDAARAGMAASRGERVTVARRLEPEPSIDAHVVEVSQDLHRSDAPRERADGRVDLTSFQNRFPQIRKGLRLLQKMPGVPGARGLDLDGSALLPPPPSDLDLRRWAGEGTVVERVAGEGGAAEYLVADKDGFLDVDAKAGTIAVRDKIVSREGVSGRTTGNLELAGAFEEFGDVQELREVAGSDITIHGSVYGNIVSSGGVIVLGANLVGGSAVNTKGDIRIRGVASAATIHARDGDIVIKGRAESCTIIGTRVKIEEASNCDIIADEVHIGVAEGCAIAARNVELEGAGPRRQAEMVVLVQTPDPGPLDAGLAELQGKIDALEHMREQFQQEAAAITAIPQVRGYMTLTAQLRKGEISLTAEQAPQLKKMAAAIEPQLKQVGHLLQKMKAAEAQRDVRRAQRDELRQQKHALAGRARCKIHLVSGETTVRCMPLKPDARTAANAAPKDAKPLLRGALAGYPLIFADAMGAVDWLYSVDADGDAAGDA